MLQRRSIIQSEEFLRMKRTANVINLLNMPIIERSKHIAKSIMNFFEDNFDYMKVIKGKLDTEMCLKLYLNMSIEKYEENSILFKSGDIGRKMYFILEGEVGILIPTNTLGVDTKNTRTIRTFEDLLKHKLYNYRLIASKKTYEHFGEIAIEQRIPRTATVATKTSCIFAVVTFDQYQKVLAQYKANIVQAKLNFCSKIPPFQFWDQPTMSMILHTSEDVEYDTNSIIYKNRAVGTHIYLILSGEIFIQKWEKVKEDGDLCEHLISNKHKIASLGLYSSGQIVGDYELFITGMSQCQITRVTQATVRQRTKVIKIPIQYYIDIINQNQLKEWMQDFLQKKYEKKWIGSSPRTNSTYTEIKQLSPSPPQNKSYSTKVNIVHTNIVDQTSFRKQNNEQFLKIAKLIGIKEPRLSVPLPNKPQLIRNTTLIKLLKKRIDDYHDEFDESMYFGLTIDSPKRSNIKANQQLCQSPHNMTQHHKSLGTFNFLDPLSNSKSMHSRFHSLASIKNRTQYSFNTLNAL